MAYSCSDLADNVTDQLAAAGLLGDSIPDDNPEECGRLIQLAIGKLIADKAALLVALKDALPLLSIHRSRQNCDTVRAIIAQAEQVQS